MGVDEDAASACEAPKHAANQDLPQHGGHLHQHVEVARSLFVCAEGVLQPEPAVLPDIEMCLDLLPGPASPVDDGVHPFGGDHQVGHPGPQRRGARPDFAEEDDLEGVLAEGYFDQDHRYRQGWIPQQVGGHRDFYRGRESKIWKALTDTQ